MADDRIGQLWMQKDHQPIAPICTASYLGNNVWITAAHCVTSSPISQLYIKQDGHSALVDNVKLLSSGKDIALLHVGDGINAGFFNLPAQRVEVGRTLYLIGYGTERQFASAAELEITNYHEKLRQGSMVYENLYETVSLTSSRSCSGDSGGAVFIEDTIYAVHTAGEPNGLCVDKQGSRMWHADLAPAVAQIKDYLQRYDQPDSIAPAASGTFSSTFRR
ncbi:S1 family peptidase [Corynebacterium cystitidis]|uniref:S1 family peptidase n=1 Tax=Corynebacterium cystitidis TaxID=35757 RepID=UPI00211DE4E0|nr:S1 family peptidase [Corynebacterium cystitidis]